MERISFPDSLKSSLLYLYITFGTENSSSNPSPNFLTRLNDFKALKSIVFDTRIDSSKMIAIRSDTLSNLPKSLTSLNLALVRFENDGLPEGGGPETKDWRKNGALSKLPRSLKHLSLEISVPPSNLDSIDFVGLFSNLPMGLESLYIGGVHSPLSFVDYLPRRLGLLVLRNSPNSPLFYEEDDILTHTDQEEAMTREERRHSDSSQFEAALRRYYSDLFWRDYAATLDDEED